MKRLTSAPVARLFTRLLRQTSVPLLLTAALAAGISAVQGIGSPLTTTLASAQVVPTPTAAPTATSTPAEVYRNSFQGLSMTLPTGWAAFETGKLVPLVEFVPRAGASVRGEVSIYNLEKPAPVLEWLIDQASAVPVVATSSVQFGPDTTAYQALVDWGSTTSLGIKELWTAVIRDTQAFLIRFFGVSTSYDESLDEINAFVSSFTLEERGPRLPSPDEKLSLWGGHILTLDPALYRGSAAGIPGAIFSGLVKLDRDLNVVPDIAKRWRESLGGTRFTFDLRTDVVFHDGRPLTAFDFKYSWERAAEPQTGSPTARTYLGDIVGVKEKLTGEATKLVGVQVMSEYTLQVTIDSPKPYFLQKLTYPTAYVVDRANVESGEDWTERPNGTGPFRLETWEKDELLVLERNDRYYKDLPWLFQVVYKLFAGVPMTLYEQREIDITSVPLWEIDRTQDPANPLNKDLRVGRTFCTSYLAFNVTVPPFDDSNVRRAFAVALDVDKYLAVTLKGTADRAAAILPPGIVSDVGADAPSESELTTVAFDPDEARLLLKQSRYGGPEGLPPIISFAQDDAMHWMWREYLGVEVEAVSLPEPQDFFDLQDAKELTLWSTAWCADYPDPQNFLEVLFHSGNEMNHFGYSSPEVDSLLEQAAVEGDPEARVTMYRQAERLVLDDWVAIPLWHNRSHQLVQTHVRGYEPSPVGIPYLQDIYFER